MIKLVIVVLISLISSFAENLNTIWETTLDNNIHSLHQTAQGIVASTENRVTFLNNDGSIRWKKDFSASEIRSIGNFLLFKNADSLLIFDYNGNQKTKIYTNGRETVHHGNRIFINNYSYGSYHLSIYDTAWNSIKSIEHPYEMIVPFSSDGYLAMKRTSTSINNGDSIIHTEYITTCRLDSLIQVVWEITDSLESRVIDALDAISLFPGDLHVENGLIYSLYKKARQMPFFVSDTLVIFNENGEIIGNCNPMPGDMYDKYEFTILPNNNILTVYDIDSYYHFLQKRKGPYFTKRNVMVNLYTPAGTQVFSKTIKEFDYNYLKQAYRTSNYYLVRYYSSQTPLIGYNSDDTPCNVLVFDLSGNSITEFDSCTSASISDSNSFLLGKESKVIKFGIKKSATLKRPLDNSGYSFLRSASLHDLINHANSAQISFSLFDLQGKKISQFNPGKNSFRNASKLRSGIYEARCSTAQSEQFSIRVTQY